MAAQPKRRISTFRGGKRTNSKKLKLQSMVTCKKCGQKKRSHYLCANCKS